MSARDRLSTTGVWYHTDTMSAGEAAEFAGRVADMGYSTLWLPDTVGRDPFAHIAWLASQVDTLQFATGIANIFHRHAGPMMQVANTLAEQTGGRFVLGLGVSHGPLVAGLRGLDYSKPYTTMKDYLAAMDASPYHGAKAAEKPLRLLAALGPKMLELSASAADGAHPVLLDAGPHRDGPRDHRARQVAVRRAEGDPVDRCRGRTGRGEHHDLGVRGAARTTATTGCGRGSPRRRSNSATRASSTPWWCGATRTA